MAELSDADRDGFGRAVAARRAELGLSRKDVVARAGLSYSYLANIESGYKHPGADALHRLAEALELRPSELLERADALAEVARGTSADVRGASEARSWFRDGARMRSAARGEPADQEMRSLVREVVREELGAAGPDRIDAARIASPASFAARPSPARRGPGPRLPAGVRAELPEWLRVPAGDPTDEAIGSVVLDELRRLPAGAGKEEVRTTIDLVLARLAERAQARRDDSLPPA